MKVVFVTRLFSPHIGGVETHVAGLCRHLPKDTDITVVTEQHDPGLPLSETLNSVKVYRIPVTGINERSKKWVIWDWIDRHVSLFSHADIIHAHDVLFWLYKYKLKSLSKKIFVTFHGWEGVYPIPLKNLIQKRFDASLAAGNICVGDFIAKWYGIKPDEITYGACSIPNIRSSPPAGRHPPRLLFLGRLDEDTGFSACLKKYFRLKPALKWRLAVAGDGSQRRLVPPEARFLGFVPDPTSYVREADYVFTTGYLGILEAFIQRKIVLSHYANPVKKDYLLFHPMARHLVFGDDFPATPSPEAFAWAKQQTWDKLAGQYLQLWSK